MMFAETKAQEHQLDDPVFKPDNYHRYFFDAEKAIAALHY